MRGEINHHPHENPRGGKREIMGEGKGQTNKGRGVTGLSKGSSTITSWKLRLTL